MALAAAKASGRQYDYDENWVYVEREYEDVLDLTYTVDEETYRLDGKYTANDHGLEMFTNTTVAVITQNLYGQNLKNKLERDVVTKSEDLIDNLTTNDATKALSAKQGKVLNDTIVSNATVSSVDNPVTWDTTGTNASSCEATMYKIGKLRMLYCTISVKSDVSSFTLMGTVSSGNRPPIDITIVGSTAGSGQVASNIQIRSNGQIRMSKATASTSSVSSYYSFLATYFVPY